MKTSKGGFCYSFPKLRGNLNGIVFPALIECKYDGEPNYLIHRPHMGTHLSNRYGLERSDFPVTEGLKGAPQMVLLGELCFGEGKKGQLYEFLKYKKDDNLNYFAYDILEYEDRDLRNLPLVERKKILSNLEIPNIRAGIFHVNGFVASDKQKAREHFKRFISNGYEGGVVKNKHEPFYAKSSYWVKMKYKDRSIYPIAYIDPTRDRIEITVDTDQKKRVGVKVSKKAQLHVGQMVLIEHLGLLESGSLRNPIFLEAETNNQLII